MTLSSLVDPAHASDSGGVAGRIGYDYQSHVAAAFVLDMIADPDLRQVECETADDITLRWERDGRVFTEYVQVKTTESESKWGIGEITKRENRRPGTSIIEKSLACDAHAGEPLFRFVSSRDVRGELALFKIPREVRSSVHTRFNALVERIGKKHAAYRSPNNRTSTYWAAHLQWDVEESEAALERKNILNLLRQAENQGERPSTALAERAYDNLLKRVTAASKASRVTAAHAKALPRDDAWIWWRDWLSQMSAAGQTSLKVYRARPDPFFVMITDIEDALLKRSMQGFDAEFDGGKWRGEELTRYLVDWLPEITLPPKLLASFTHLEARNLIKQAVDAVAAHGRLAMDRVLAELMLNAILRQYRRSEPIACKLFTNSVGVVHANSAHIVHSDSTDEIWLGQARLTTAADHDRMVRETLDEISATFDRDVLKREREVIVQLRDPNHLKVTNIERCLSRNAKLDDFLKVLRIPVLLAYDSAVIAAGNKPGYVESLIAEVTASYHRTMALLPTALNDAQVHFFLIPVQCAVSLASSFEKHLNGQ